MRGGDLLLLFTYFCLPHYAAELYTAEMWPKKKPNFTPHCCLALCLDKDRSGEKCDTAWAMQHETMRVLAFKTNASSKRNRTITRQELEQTLTAPWFRS